AHVIFINWGIFLYGVEMNLVVEVAMGYFMNPLVVALLGVIVLKEKLRLMQWLAIALCGVAIAYLVITYGQIPWIALGVTATFAIYSLIKRLVGPKIRAVDGLMVETLWLMPAAIIVLIIVSQTSGLVW